MSNRVTAYKSLASNEYKITPFRTYASHNYTYVSGSTSNSEDVQVFLGVKYITGSGLRTENFNQEIYDSVIQTFYSPVPYASYGIQSSSYHPTGSTFIISITQDIFGEEVKPKTFSVRVGTSMSFDDGKGNLIMSSSGTGSVIGRIFYDKGIAIFKPTSSFAGGGITNDGIHIDNGTNVNVKFTSSVQLKEHSIRVRLNPTEFLFSAYNPSVSKPIYSGSTQTAVQLMASQSLYPYITTIGLYNPDNELLAVAKISNPIQRTDYSVQTFIVKFDT